MRRYPPEQLPSSSQGPCRQLDPRENDVGADTIVALFIAAEDFALPCGSDPSNECEGSEGET